MSKWKGKLARRIMAIVLSGAMVMSNMSAYAAELTTETETEEVSEIEESTSSTTDEAVNDEDSTSLDNSVGEDGSGGDAGGTGDGQDGETTASLSKPGSLSIDKKQGDDTKLVLTWSASSVTPENSGYETIKYSVKATEKDQASEIITETNIETTSYEFEASKLTSGKTYIFTVTAEAQKSEGSDTITSESTYEYEYTETDAGGEVTVSKPENPSVTYTITDGKISAKFSWDSVTVEGYTITYDVTVKEKDSDSQVVTRQGLSSTEITISNESNETLEVGKTYIFSVVAKAAKDNEVKSSDASEVEKVFKEAAALDAPAESSLEFEEKTTTDDAKKPYVVFKWGAVALEGYAISYDIKVTEGTGNSETEKFTGTTTETSIEIGKTDDFAIEADTEYTFSVTAKAVKGEGESAEEITADPVSKTYTYTDPGSSEAVDETVHTIEITSDGLQKSETYGDENILTLKVLEDMNIPEKRTKPGTSELKIVSGMAWDTSYQGDNNAKPDKGNIPTSGSAFVIDAKEDAKIYFVTEKITKAWHFVEVSVNGDTESKVKDTPTAANPNAVAGTLTFTLKKGQRYYLYGDGTKITVFGIMYHAYDENATRAEWNDVTKPTISDVKINETGTKRFDVTVDAVVGTKGGDKLTVEMINAEGVSVSAETVIPNTTHKISFIPEASGKYTFKATLSRDGETAKSSEETSPNEFKAILKAPGNLKITDTEGSLPVEFSWDAVKDATSYNVIVTEAVAEGATEAGKEVFKQEKVTDPKVVIETGLEPGKSYVFSVASVKSAEGVDDETSEPATKEYAMPKPSTPGVGIQTYVFDAEEELGPNGLNVDKKGAVPEGAKFADDYFTVIGSGAIRGNAGTYSLEVNTGISLGFNITGTAAVTIEVSSNGSNSTSAFGIADASGNIVPNTEGKNTVLGSGATKFTYKGLTEGSYRICSQNLGDGSGTKVRIYTVTVEETPAGKKVDIDLSVKKEADGKKYALLAGEKYGDPEIATLEVLEDFEVKDGGESCGQKYDFSVAGNVNPSPNKGAIPEKGAVFKVTAVKDTTAKFIVKAAAGKAWHVVRESDGKEVKKGTAVPEMVEFKAKAGETYYFYGDGTKIMTYAITLSEYIFIPRGDWANVAAPAITKHVIEEKDGANTIKLTVTGDVSRDGGDALTVEMYDADGDPEEVIASKSVAAAGDITITPNVSGRYTFKAFLSRNPEEPEDDDGTGEEIVFDDKESALYPATDAVDFQLILQPPLISAVTNRGNGTIEVDWGKASEATGYEVLVTDKDGNPAGTPLSTEQNSDTIGEVSGLTVGETYKVQVRAKRTVDEVTDYSAYSDAVEKLITEKAQMKWSFSASGSSTSVGNAKPADKPKGYGANTAQPKNGFHKEGEKDNDFDVEVWSIAGSGKVVPATTDGLAFYYTELNPNDPENPNFELTATAHVESWKFSNGQDGFGLMVSDTVGEHGNGDYVWTNCYQNVVSKVEFKWDGTKPADDGTIRYSMKLGVGATEKIGATAQDITDIWSGKLSAPAVWSATQHPLDFSMTHLPAGTYNVVGNCENTPEGSLDELSCVDFDLRIEKNNNGYKLSCTNVKTGKTEEKQFYGKDVLNQIESDKIYVGVFAGRNADVTFKNVHIEQHPKTWGPEETEQETKYINLAPLISSPTTSNTSEYDFVFTSNWDGKLEIRDRDMNVVGKADVTGSLDTVKAQLKDGDNEKDTKAHVTLSGLQIGSNAFTVTFTPNKKMVNQPAYTELTSYEPVTLSHTVDYRKYGDNNSILYVSQEGKSSGTGTKANPLDIYTAIKYVQPGQKIFLAGGRYVLNKTISIPRGTNGEEGKMIYLMKDPEASERPVFDFNGKVTGMTLGGNYWYFKGFDVTRSLDGQKGIQLSGSHNVLDQVNAYMNGNTGIQVSGSGNDTYNYWPQYNAILNCTSYLNSDHGYEDADGFAAKLTIGSGNVFDGCIAAYNADDGWDLFAKIESGQIGSVTIRNSVAYKNGYVLKDAKGSLSLKGEEVDAGNGNGFKMGGDGLPGGSIYDTVDGKEGSESYYEKYGKYKGHILENSIAFENKSKGFDSNSCPNNKIYNSVSFNNKGGNVELYTYNNIQETDYEVKDVISFRTKYTSVIDSVSPKGSQKTDKSAFINESTYLWNKRPCASINSNGVRVDKTWFKTITFTGTTDAKIDPNHVLLGRNADGSINTGGFLTVIKENVGTGLKPVESPTDEALKGDSVETEGNISAGNGSITDEDTSGELFEEEQNALEMRGIWIPEPTEEEEALYYTYTGLAVKPEIRVYLNGKRFTDYSVSYKNNINAYVAGDEQYSAVTDDKRPQMILKMKGSYQGDYIHYFNIYPRDIGVNEDGKHDVAAPDIAVDKAQVPKVTLTYNGKKLALGKDFNIYRDVVSKDENGVETVTSELVNKTSLSETTTLKVKGIGNFTGNADVQFIMVTSDSGLKMMSKAKAKLNKTSFLYTGKEVRPEITLDGDRIIKANEAGEYVDDLYTVSIVGGTEVGKGAVIITAKTIASSATVEEGTTPAPLNAVYAGSISVPFTIAKAPIKIDNIIFVSRDGKESKGKEIIFDDVKYTGSARAQAGEFKVVMEDGTVATGISKGSRDINDSDPKNGKLYKYDYTYEYKNNIEAGNANIIIKGIHNYTGSVSLKFKITPADPVAASDVKQYRKAYTEKTADGQTQVIKPEKMTGKGLEIVYDYDMAYVSSGAQPAISIYYNGNGVSKKNYSISYKDNKKVGGAAQAIISWKGGLKGTDKTTLEYRIGQCEFEGNIYVKSILDVFTNGKNSIKASEFDKSKAVIMNAKTKLSNNRDYTLEYRYPEYDTNLKPVMIPIDNEHPETLVQSVLTYDASTKDSNAKKKPVYVPTTGLDVEVYAKPVEGSSYKADEPYKIADIRVAYYDIAKANIQLLEWDNTKQKYVKPILYFKDVTEDSMKNVADAAMMNRLNKEYVKIYHSTYAKDYEKEKNEYLSYINYETRKGDGYTYKESSTDTLVAGTQKVTFYRTGLFGGSKVFKYKLEKKTYNIAKSIIDTKTKFYFASDEYMRLRSEDFTNKPEEKRQLEQTVKAQFNEQIARQLEGRITGVNGVTLSSKYYECAYGKDFDNCVQGKAIAITIKGANAYSGIKTIKVPTQLISSDLSKASVAAVSVQATQEDIKKGIEFGKEDAPLNKAIADKITVEGFTLSYGVEYEVNDAEYVAFEKDENGNYVEDPNGETMTDEKGEIIKDEAGNPKKFKVARRYTGYMNNTDVSTEAVSAYVCLKGIGGFNGVIEVPFTITEKSTEEKPAQ